jgi:hypothetical protein
VAADHVARVLLRVVGVARPRVRLREFAGLLVLHERASTAKSSHDSAALTLSITSRACSLASSLVFGFAESVIIRNGGHRGWRRSRRTESALVAANDVSGVGHCEIG